MAVAIDAARQAKTHSASTTHCEVDLWATKMERHTISICIRAGGNRIDGLGWREE